MLVSVPPEEYVCHSVPPESPGLVENYWSSNEFCLCSVIFHTCATVNHFCNHFCQQMLFRWNKTSDLNASHRMQLATANYRICRKLADKILKSGQNLQGLVQLEVASMKLQLPGVTGQQKHTPKHTHAAVCTFLCLYLCRVSKKMQNRTVKREKSKQSSRRKKPGKHTRANPLPHSLHLYLPLILPSLPPPSLLASFLPSSLSPSFLHPSLTAAQPQSKYSDHRKVIVLFAITLFFFFFKKMSATHC